MRLGALLAAAATGDKAGASSGTSVIVLALYGSIFVVALVAWIAWGVRQERGGVIQWGEQQGETFGQKLARMWKAASAPPKSPDEAQPQPLPDDEEVDQRHRTAG